MANKFGVFVNNDWSSTANWALTYGGATGAAIPAAADAVYVVGGTYSVTAGLNQSAITVASLSILDGYGGAASGLTIGDDSNPLQINVTNSLTIANRRLLYSKWSGTIGTLDLQTLGQGRCYLSAGPVTTCLQGDGYLEVADAAKVTNYSTAGGSALFKGDSSSPVDLVMEISNGATVECWRKIHTVVTAGYLKTAYSAVGSATSGTSKWRAVAGGTIDIRSTGDIVGIEAYAGSRVTAEYNPGLSPVPTIATLTEHRGSTITVPTQLITITTRKRVGFAMNS